MAAWPGPRDTWRGATMGSSDRNPTKRRWRMATFDRDTLQRLHDSQEIAIRTGKHPDKPVTIWVAVAGEKVFVRSVRGPRGRWYRDLAKGGPAEVDVAGRRVAVQATPAGDESTVGEASR